MQSTRGQLTGLGCDAQLHEGAKYSFGGVKKDAKVFNPWGTQRRLVSSWSLQMPAKYTLLVCDETFLANEDIAGKISREYEKWRAEYP